MKELLHTWIMGLVAASCAAALARELTPRGPVRKVTVFLCGVMLCAVLIEPIVLPDGDILSLSAAEYRKTVRDLTEDVRSREKELLRTYIEEEAAAYILDEATQLGISNGTAEIRAKWGDESWMPYEAYLRMDATEEQRLRLSRSLISELGIPPERQHWTDEDR